MNSPRYSNFYHQPVIIIGAGRSGTNMLRDVLVQLPGFGTWPCDEINYIWRHGNVRYPSDEFLPEQALFEVKKYIRKSFSNLAQKHRLTYVVEKTCANSLRVDFVRQVFPNGKFIFIVRDGRDVIASAMKRWTASFDLPYVLRKAWYVPISDLPYYGIKYFLNHLHRAWSRDGKLVYWGPCFEGMKDILHSKSLAEICAMQWVRCVEKAEQGLCKVDSSSVYQLRYEDFVKQPSLEVDRLVAFLGIDAPSTEWFQQCLMDVKPQHIGKWKSELDSRDLSRVQPLIQSTLQRHGYV